MSRGMVSFLAGMGAGYIKAKDKALEQERQKSEDAWREEQRGRQRQEWAASDKLNADLKDAAAPVQVQEGAGGFVKPDTMDNRDVGLPENAGQPNGGLMQGQFKVADKSFADRTAADKEAGDANSTSGIAARTAAAYRRNGKVGEAMSMENAVMDQKAKKLGLDAAELKFADDQFNRQLGETFANSPDWTAAAAQVLTKTQVGGLAGVSVQAVPSQDGKKVDFVGQSADGQQKVLATFDNSDAGKAQFLQRVMRAPVETKIGWIVEEARSKQAQANADREHALKSKEVDARADYYSALAGAKDAAPAKSPYERMDEFDTRTLSGIQEDRKQIRGAILKAEAEGTTNPEGVRKLEAQLAALSLRERQIQAKYATQGTEPDPAGLRRPSPAPSGSPAGTSRVVVSAETQRARDSDRVAILQNELASAKARLASGDRSAEADVAALTRELGRAEKTPAARPAPAPASAPTPPAQPRQQATMSRPEPAAPPAAQQGSTMSMGDYMKSLAGAFSGNSQAQINGIKQKLANGLALSGTEQVIARQAGLIRAR